MIRESKRRSQPCGKWLLSHPVLQAWLQSSEHHTIWVTGVPGSGKTVLSTSIVDRVREYVKDDSEKILAFIYCEKGGENDLSLTSILATIIAQILANLDSVPGCISAACEISERYGRSNISTADQPMVILKDLISSIQRLYIIVDGLDEFQDVPSAMETFKQLVADTETVRFCLFSRELAALHSQVSGVTRISLGPAAMNTDIENYVSRQLLDLPVGKGLRESIFDKISQGANGMFLWAHLMVQTLKAATSHYEMMEILSDLPAGLDIIYGAILKKLSKEPFKRRALAKRVLLWICCSTRALHWRELASALAVDDSCAEVVESKKPFKSAVLEICSPLIEHLPENDLIRPTHLSVREFLLSSGNHLLEPSTRQFFVQQNQGNHEIAQVCLAYQSWHNANDPVNTDATAYPFLEYATLYWSHHLSGSFYDSMLELRTVSFLSSRFRRQLWISRFLFWQSTLFPLQYLMKQQKLLADWRTQGPNNNLQHDLGDCIQDIQEILLHDNALCKEQHPQIELLPKIMPKISYFEKLMVIRDLSREYNMGGRLEEGERWLTDALEYQRQKFGQMHVSTAWLMNSLGIIYDQQEKVELSAHTQEQALAIQESHHEPNNLETTWTVNELGRVYRHLSQLEKAERMHLRALEQLRTVLPPDDPQIAWTLNTLARTHRKQGRFEDAIDLHSQALNVQKHILGENHPHTLWAVMDLAACYRGQGRLQESADLYRKALGGREKVLGLRHMDTLWAMNDLGLVLEALGGIRAAKTLHEKALHGQRELLGSEHKHTVWTRETLAKLNKEIQ